MNKYTNILLGAILALLLLNLGLTASILVQKPSSARVSAQKLQSFNKTMAVEWGRKVAEMYNQQDHERLYALFSEQAKVKISHQQLKDQLQKLYLLFGSIEKSAFVKAEKVGEQNNQIYYQLRFNIRITGTKQHEGTLNISVVQNAGEVHLYGVRINSTQNL